MLNPILVRSHLLYFALATMPKIRFDLISLGEQYERKELAPVWGYKWQALSRGVVTPAGDNVVVLFVTLKKQKALTQYEDHFDGDLLHWQGETNHAADMRVVNAEMARDEIHLFCRDRHHSPFIYYGQVYLKSYELKANEPSHFVFATERAEASAAGVIATEKRTHGVANEDFTPDTEGRRIIRQHVTYERSPRNRARALEIHGTRCKVCDFDFNEVYGTEFARDFIEVHHTRSIAEAKGEVVNPATDLVPVCSNCHSMVHRERSRVVPIQELRDRVMSTRTPKLG